jgi:DNA (cytosine-5)-methyltransferase 1
MSSNDTIAISLFSGAGGLDLGCHMAGVEVISAVDFDLDSTKTMMANEEFKNCLVQHSDVKDLSIDTLRGLINERKPRKVIVIGGPPCQPFSKNGYWVKNENRLSSNDPRNMIDEYFRIVEEIQPDGFLLENVESILHPTNKNAVESIENHIYRLGYTFKLVRTNALDFGVPQKRKRVFFIASKKKLNGEMPERTHCPPSEVEFFPHLKPYKKVGEVIQKFASVKYFEEQEVATKGTYYNDLVEVPPGKNYLVLTEKAGYPNPKFVYGKRFWNFLLKLHPDEYSWTIPAQPGPWVGPFHWDNRRLRVPEIAAIQSFPEGYKFHGSRRSIQKQIGNAVPPLLGKAMIEFLIKNT